MEWQIIVIICGGGPTGALLSALLGKADVPNIVLGKEADITADPRGIVLDDDGIRALQAIGLYEKVRTEIGSAMTKFNFISRVQSDLSKKPLLYFDQSTSEGGTRHVDFICHKQPSLERAIRDVLTDSPHSQLRTRCLLTAIREQDDSVVVQYTNADGQSKSLRGNFLVGADGKTGFVRKRYLEPKGITMDKTETSALTQACLVGQTFGSLSGQTKHSAIVDAFHGTVISFARRSKVFQTQHTSLPNQQDPDGSWGSWRS